MQKIVKNRNFFEISLWVLEFKCDFFGCYLLKKDTFSLYKMRSRWLDLDDSSGREINLNKTRILRITRYDAGQQKIIFN